MYIEVVLKAAYLNDMINVDVQSIPLTAVYITENTLFNCRSS